MHALDVNHEKPFSSVMVQFIKTDSVSKGFSADDTIIVFYCCLKLLKMLKMAQICLTYRVNRICLSCKIRK